MSDQEEFDDLEMDVDLSQAGADDDVDELSDGDDDDDSGDSEIDAEVQLYEKYAELLAQISADSYNYDNYVQLVELAQWVSKFVKKFHIEYRTIDIHCSFQSTQWFG